MSQCRATRRSAPMRRAPTARGAGLTGSDRSWRTLEPAQGELGVGRRKGGEALGTRGRGTGKRDRIAWQRRCSADARTQVARRTMLGRPALVTILMIRVMGVLVHARVVVATGLIQDHRGRRSRRRMAEHAGQRQRPAERQEQGDDEQQADRVLHGHSRLAHGPWQSRYPTSNTPIIPDAWCSST